MSDNSIQKFLDELKTRYQHTVAQVEKDRELYERVIAAMPRDTVVRLFGDVVGLDIHATGDKHEFAAAVRAYRINGFKADDMPKAGESNPHIWMRHPDGAVSILYFTSKSCRRVKVGTKMVEQDVYETVCDEQINPTRAA